MKIIYSLFLGLLILSDSAVSGVWKPLELSVDSETGETLYSSSVRFGQNNTIVAGVRTPWKQYPQHNQCHLFSSDLLTPSNWQKIHTSPHHCIRSVVFASQNHPGMLFSAISASGIDDVAGGYHYLSQDSGSQWNEFRLPAGDTVNTVHIGSPFPQSMLLAVTTYSYTPFWEVGLYLMYHNQEGQLVLDREIKAIVQANKESNLLYAIGDGLWRTEDGGRNWTEQAINDFPPISYAESMVISERDDYLYITEWGHSERPGRLFGYSITTDSWTELQLPPNPSYHTLKIDPNSSRRLYLGTYTEGVFESNDGGQSWRQLGKGLEDESIWDLDISEDGHYLVASASSGIYLYALAIEAHPVSTLSILNLLFLSLFLLAATNRVLKNTPRVSGGVKM